MRFEIDVTADNTSLRVQADPSEVNDVHFLFAKAIEALHYELTDFEYCPFHMEKWRDH